MVWVIGGVGALWLLIVSASFRKTALVIAGLIGALGLTLYLVDEQNNAQRKAKQAELESKIPHQQVVFSDVAELNEFGSRKLVGTVRNNSRFEIGSMVATFEIFDCPTYEAPVEQCLSIGKDDDIYLSGEVPAGSARSFSGYVTIINEAPVKGFRRTVYGLVNVRAKG